ncbi:TetR/AcrR family transcriptional regulator [Fodinicola acaciae]|uniref:TetR/AcrR family transcriptional regulator n=1 Tax=Fodinicola acaciae TaxID=2681555 RepID=UPI0013D10BE3|nr:TetR/AcrR family transcriptional regulator [Fodinicola acaciae]
MNARSRRTREALLAATRELLTDGGFEAVTMAAVADRAGVSRRGVYLHFPSRSELIDELAGQIADEAGLAPSLDPVFQAADPVSALRAWAGHLGTYVLRIAPVMRAADRVHQVDPDAARHRAKVHANQLLSCQMLMAWLDHAGLLAEPWTVDSAAEMLQALSSPDLPELLIVEHGWPLERFQDHVAALLERTFRRMTT